MTSLNKSDIVSKASSLHVQESITMPDKSGSKADAGAAREPMMPIDDPIGAALRRLHDEVVAEPLPDDFLRLLGEIERKLDGTAPSE
ncbi:MAG: NepR family anti-sigma factor [Chakrabartia godavariana]